MFNRNLQKFYKKSIYLFLFLAALRIYIKVTADFLKTKVQTIISVQYDSAYTGT